MFMLCCRLTEEGEETLDHLVSKCPCLRQARKDHFMLKKIQLSHNWTLEEILKYTRIKAIDLGLRDKDSSNMGTD